MQALYCISYILLPPLKFSRDLAFFYLFISTRPLQHQPCIIKITVLQKPPLYPTNWLCTRTNLCVMRGYIHTCAQSTINGSVKVNELRLTCRFTFTVEFDDSSGCPSHDTANVTNEMLLSRKKSSAN